MNTQKLTKESTGFFENKKIKTVIYLKDGKLVASYYYGTKTNERLTQQLLLDDYIKHSEEWTKTYEYTYIKPDEEKGWYQPNSGIKLKNN